MNLIEYFNVISKKALKTDALLFEKGVLPSVVWAMDWEEHHYMGILREQFQTENHIDNQYNTMNATHPSEDHLKNLKNEHMKIKNKMHRAPATKTS